MSVTVVHPFAPVYDRDSRVLLLGSIPSPKSRETRFYYGHPQNRFWLVLSRLFDEPAPRSVSEKTAFLLRRHIALWDVLRSCDIQGADDASIRNPVPNDIGELLSKTRIRAVFATGSKAAALYRRHCLPQTGLACVPLPSTSPANCRMSLDALTEQYRAILPWLNQKEDAGCSTGRLPIL